MRLRVSWERRQRPQRTLAPCAGRPSPTVASRDSGPHPVRILSICDYDGLRLARELLLTQEGYCLKSHASSDPLDVFSARSCQLAIICHSVALEAAMRIADMLHRYNSAIYVLRLSKSDLAHSSCFDGELESFCAPGLLLEAIREVIGNGSVAQHSRRPGNLRINRGSV